MRLLFIRHAEPTHPIDDITKKGEAEAEALAKWLKEQQIDEIYVSPLLRAQKTFKAYQELTGCEAKTAPWLAEFKGKAHRPEYDRPYTSWDFPPSALRKEFFDVDGWRKMPEVIDTGCVEEYDRVVKCFLDCLAEHGYVKDGLNFRVEKSNHDTIAFFCHFGITAVLLSALSNVSPYVYWQNTVVLPTGTTLLISEEREKGIASFRAQYIGSLSHLDAAKIEPSFHARFCECFDDETRHI